VTLEELNAAHGDALARDLLACCDVPRWAEAVTRGRPYDGLDELLARADQAARDLNPTEVDRALAAHPRIGARTQGPGTSAKWSRQEQSAVGDDAATAQALLEGNRAYEERFGRVFLICATGLTGEQILDALHERLGNDSGTEDRVVADELRKIALVRVAKLLDEPRSDRAPVEKGKTC
jgi:2-oxo-4-hydroxy-4-carboxy-5-ureidoimidazoline decarboxylase